VLPHFNSDSEVSSSVPLEKCGEKDFYVERQFFSIVGRSVAIVLMMAFFLFVIIRFFMWRN